MKNVGIVYNKTLENAESTALKIQKLFSDKKMFSKIFDIDNFDDSVDFVISIGGDGTLLRTARFYSKLSTPVFGVNIGHLGFLSQVQANEIEHAVEEICSSKFHIEKRTMLEASISEKKMFALNDIVVKGCTFSRTARFSVLINNHFVCEYLADGIIISTPTGSTAYNLSAGGPILYPTIGAFTIVPICPHTITARPLVIPNTEKISIIPSSTQLKLHVNADGQEVIDCYEQIDVKKADQEAHLALLNQTNEFYSILRQKLNWGTAPKPL